MLNDYQINMIYDAAEQYKKYSSKTIPEDGFLQEMAVKTSQELELIVSAATGKDMDIYFLDFIDNLKAVKKEAIVNFFNYE